MGELFFMFCRVGEREKGEENEADEHDSAIEILKSASKYGKNVKAIAVTGSVNAITTGADVATRTYNSSEWLPVHPYSSLPLPSTQIQTDQI